MKRLTPIRWILKDLWAQRTSYGVALLFLILLFSATGFTLVFKDSTEAFSEKKTRESLAADLEISSQRPFTEAELTLIRETLTPLKESSQARIRTVAVGKEKSLLTHVEGIDEAFPLEGELVLEGSCASKPCAWVDRALMEGLDLKPGSSLQLGSGEFEVAGLIEKDTTSGFSPFGLTSKVYIREKDLSVTGLMGPGNQVSYRKYFLLPAQNRSERIEQIKQKLDTDDFYFRSPEEGSFQIQRTLNVIEQSVSLVTLLLILLSLLSGYFIFQSQAFSQMNAMAILRSIGLPTSRVLLLYSTELLILLITAAIIAAAVCLLLLPQAEAYFARVGLGDFVWVLEPQTLFAFAASLVLVTVALSIPLALSIQRAQVTSLFQSEFQSKGTERWGAVALLFVSFFVSWLVTENLVTALLFLGVLSLLIVLLSQVGPLVGSALKNRAKGHFRVPLVQLSSARLGTRLGPVVLIFIVFVMQFVPHLYESVVSEIKVRSADEGPSFFVVNIQEEDRDTLRDFVTSKGAKLDFESPMVLARLTAKNGEPIEEDFFKRIPVRLSYRKGLFPSETLVKGTLPDEDFQGGSEKLPSLSMEDRYAKRWGFELGDRLTFNVLGTEIVAQVDSLRKIDWLQFQPNFFMQLQTGVLEDAPKTFIAAIYAPKEANKVQLFRELTEGFPGLSLIDISQSIQRGLEIIGKVEASLKLMSQFAIFFCLLVFLFLFYDQMNSRRGEVRMLLIKGSQRAKVFLIYATEFGLTLFVSWIFASLLALLTVAVILARSFESTLVPSLGAVLSSLGICFVLLLVMLFIFSRLSKIQKLDHI